MIPFSVPVGCEVTSDALELAARPLVAAYERLSKQAQGMRETAPPAGEPAVRSPTGDTLSEEYVMRRGQALILDAAIASLRVALEACLSPRAVLAAFEARESADAGGAREFDYLNVPGMGDGTSF